MKDVNDLPEWLLSCNPQQKFRVDYCKLPTASPMSTHWATNATWKYQPIFGSII